MTGLYNKVSTGLFLKIVLWCLGSVLFTCQLAMAQTGPSATEVTGYTGLHAAAWEGDAAAMCRLIESGEDLEKRDSAGRTALHVAAFAKHPSLVTALVDAGADPNALEHESYDIITIAAVANDLEVLQTALRVGGNPSNVTSPYDGTALIAAAHLGHVDVVQILIDAGAPLDHVNNLGWTALIEAVVLGDGKTNHVKIVRALRQAGADVSLTDNQGRTASDLAQARGYQEMVDILR